MFIHTDIHINKTISVELQTFLFIQLMTLCEILSTFLEASILYTTFKMSSLETGDGNFKIYSLIFASLIPVIIRITLIKDNYRKIRTFSVEY